MKLYWSRISFHSYYHVWTRLQRLPERWHRSCDSHATHYGSTSCCSMDWILSLQTLVTMNTKTFALPSLPASINALYLIDTTGRRRFQSGKPRVVYMAEEARKWKSDMQYLIPRFEIESTSLLRIDYTAYYPWIHRNGKRRRVDVHNLMKLLFDTVCARIGVDDSRVSCGSFASVDAPEEKIEITLTELPDVQLTTEGSAPESGL